MRVALGEYDIGWHDPDASITKLAALASDARSAAAHLLVVPEMCTTGFSMDPGDLATPIDGPQARQIGDIAARNGVWIIAGLAAREQSDDKSCLANVATIFDPQGTLVATYHKQRLFPIGAEHRNYVAGAKHTIVEIEGVRVAPFICYDLRFPELFRPIARDVDAFVVIANWATARQDHWDLLLRARAVENLAWVVGVNRTGIADGLEYTGGSVVYSPWGERVAEANGESLTVVDVDAERVRDVRAKYPFLESMSPR
jgi:predicted amidohydrolase